MLQLFKTLRTKTPLAIISIGVYFVLKAIVGRWVGPQIALCDAILLLPLALVIHHCGLCFGAVFAATVCLADAAVMNFISDQSRFWMETGFFRNLVTSEVLVFVVAQAARREQRAREGLPIDPGLLHELSAVGDEWGVTFPA